MKKIMAIILLLAALSISLTACGEKKTEIKSDEQAKEAVVNLTGDLDSLGDSLDSLNEKLS